MTRPQKHMLAVFALLWGAMLSSPLVVRGQATQPTEPARAEPIGPARPGSPAARATQADAKVLVCTDPNQPGALVTPADVLDTCSVADVIITTNRREPAHLVTAAEMAAKMGGYLIVDLEHRRTGLDLYLTDRPAWRKNLAESQADLALVWKTEPGLKVFAYDKIPARLGLPRSADWWTLRDFLAVQREERAALRVAGRLLEAYTLDWTGGSDEALFLAWAEDLDFWALAAEAQGAPGEVLCICSPWKYDAARDEWVRTSDKLWERQLRHLLKEGYRPLIFNPQGAGWDAVRKVAGRN